MTKSKKISRRKLFTSSTLCFMFCGILILAIILSSCTNTAPIPTNTPPPSPIIPFITNTPPRATNTPPPTPVITQRYYVDGTNGNDENDGSESQPWQSIKKAVDVANAGNMIIIHGGEYISPMGGWVFQNSGTASHPIHFTNYPNEQVLLKIPVADNNNYNIFRCTLNPKNPASWQTPKADYIKIIGTNVSPRLLSNGVESQKGIVMQGVEGEQSSAIAVSDCDYWEIAGIDFIETAAGIRTFKNNWSSMEEHSTDYWHVHNNRVYNFYRESGMQFNGNFNLIENNEIYKVSNRLDSPHGCQMLNLLGNNNIVRGNTLSRLGSTVECIGLLFEWDLSDANLVEENTIYDVFVGIASQGGDNNIIQNNTITGGADTAKTGVQISSYENRTDWPCNDYPGSGAGIEAALPPDNPTHPDYQYYYNPRDCHSRENQIIRNSIIGFQNAWLMVPIEDDSNIFLDNITSAP